MTKFDAKPDVNADTEVRDCCGVFAEIGSIIRPDDNVFAFPLAYAEKAETDAVIAKIQAYLTETFGDTVSAQFDATDAEETAYQVTLEFSCTAEKLIFEMNLPHLV